MDGPWIGLRFSCPCLSLFAFAISSWFSCLVDKFSVLLANKDCSSFFVPSPSVVLQPKTCSDSSFPQDVPALNVGAESVVRCRFLDFHFKSLGSPSSAALHICSTPCSSIKHFLCSEEMSTLTFCFITAFDFSEVLLFTQMPLTMLTCKGYSVKISVAASSIHFILLSEQLTCKRFPLETFLSEQSTGSSLPDEAKDVLSFKSVGDCKHPTLAPCLKLKDAMLAAKSELPFTSIH
eukprot:Gb_22688 [translate_table: standard]